MSKKLTPMVGLLLASSLLAFPHTPPQDPVQDQSAELQDLVVRPSPHRGDLDQMVSGVLCARWYPSIGPASFSITAVLVG